VSPGPELPFDRDAVVESSRRGRGRAQSRRAGSREAHRGDCTIPSSNNRRIKLVGQQAGFWVRTYHGPGGAAPDDPCSAGMVRQASREGWEWHGAELPARAF
jgi:hypothetical protein